jgi:hypothetical protein
VVRSGAIALGLLGFHGHRLQWAGEPERRRVGGRDGRAPVLSHVEGVVG